jgi:hypothetical protein
MPLIGITEFTIDADSEQQTDGIWFFVENIFHFYKNSQKIWIFRA